MKKSQDEAKEIILNSTNQKIYESVTLEDGYNRVLAEDIIAKFDIPDAPKSAIDGYTFDFESIKSYPVSLRIIGESRAGKPFKGKVDKGEAVFTMTGAVVPNGANTAVRIEDVTVKDNIVTIQKAPKKGDLINPKGDEVSKGEAILKKGDILDYKKIALLSNLGYYKIKVFSRPRIGIVVTGDEVKEPWEDSDKAGVKNSNLYILKGMLLPYADIHYYGIIRDDIESMVPLFSQALKENDILLSSGGASKGKYDFTKDIAKAINLDIKFTTTNIRPGRPLIFGTKENRLFFGLPGYPSALLVNAINFLLPAVKKMAGFREYENSYLKAITDDDLHSKKGRVDFIRVTIKSNDDATLHIQKSSSQQTSNYLTMAQSSALAILDETRGEVKKGEVVDIIEM